MVEAAVASLAGQSCAMTGPEDIWHLVPRIARLAGKMRMTLADVRIGVNAIAILSWHLFETARKNLNTACHL